MLRSLVHLLPGKEQRIAEKIMCCGSLEHLLPPEVYRKGWVL